MDSAPTLAGRTLLATVPGLAAFLAGLPSLALSDTGRRNVGRRFALTEQQALAALNAHGPTKGGRSA